MKSIRRAVQRLCVTRQVWIGKPALVCAAALWFVGAACSKEPRRTPSEVTTCAQAGAAFAEALAGGLINQKHAAEKVELVRSRAAEEVAATCETHEWDSSTFACLSKVETVADMNACKIPPQSESQLSGRMKVIVTEAMGP